MLLIATAGKAILSILWGEANEDDGRCGSGWRPNCTLEICGDDIVDSAGEECDDDNNLGADGCSGLCLVEVIG